MFHFQHWPDHGVPKDFGKLLSLVSRVEKSQQQQNENQPIVIICRYLQFLVGLLYSVFSDLFRNAISMNPTLRDVLACLPRSLSARIYVNL